MSKDRDDRHGTDLAAALRNPNAAIINLRLSAADAIDSLAIELEWVRNAFDASQMGEAQSYDKVKGHAVTQSDAEDKPIGFRTNDVPDPYAEGPQSDAKPVAWARLNERLLWWERPKYVSSEPLFTVPPRHDVLAFAKAVLHGDDEHKLWLLDAAEAFVEGRPIPPPQGKGTSAQSNAAADYEQVFTDICDQLGCAYDNEAALFAIEQLTKERDEARVGAQVNLEAAHRIMRINDEARNLLRKFLE